MTILIRWVVVAVLVGHGLLHLLGAAKGFGWAEVAQLRHPIGPGDGVVWLPAAVLVLGSAALIATRAPRGGGPSPSSLRWSPRSPSSPRGATPSSARSRTWSWSWPPSTASRHGTDQLPRPVARPRSRGGRRRPVGTDVVGDRGGPRRPAGATRRLRTALRRGRQAAGDQLLRPLPRPHSQAARPRRGCPSQASSSTPTDLIRTGCSSWTRPGQVYR